jgi:hypothetical protein
VIYRASVDELRKPRDWGIGGGMSCTLRPHGRPRPNIWLLCGARTRSGRPCLNPGIGIGGRCIKHGGCAISPATGPVVLFDGYAPDDEPEDFGFIAGQLWLAPERVAVERFDATGDWCPPVRGDGADWAEPARAQWPHRIGTGVIRRILSRQLQRVAYVQLATPDGWDSLLRAIPSQWPSSKLPELASLIRVTPSEFSRRWAQDGWGALAAREWADE